MTNAFWLVLSGDGHAVVRAPHETGALQSSGFSERSHPECIKLDLDAATNVNAPGTPGHLRECIMRVVYEPNSRLREIR